LLRSRIRVADTLSDVGGRLEWVAPKTYAKRDVKLPRWVTEMLAPLCSGGADELVFAAPQGGPVRQNNFRSRVWLPALKNLNGTVPMEMTPTIFGTRAPHC
jgi:hypothetical protein